MFGHGDLIPDIGGEIARIGEFEVSDTGQETIFDLLLADKTVGCFLLVGVVGGGEEDVMVGGYLVGVRRVGGCGREGKGGVPGEITFFAKEFWDDGGSLEGG